MPYLRQNESRKRNRKWQRRKALIRIYIRRPTLLRRTKSRLNPPRDTPRGVYLRVKSTLDGLTPATNDRLSELAHSRPALEIRSPAFFRHAIYFFPHAPKERNPLLHPGNFDRRGTMRKLGSLVARLAGREVDDILKDLNSRFEADQSYVVKIGTYLDFDLRAVIDVYTEYATLTLVLDNNRGVMSDAAVASNPQAIVKHIQDQIKARRLKIGEAAYKEWFEAEYGSGEAVFFGIWELLNSEKGTRLSKSGIGNMVGDFRGFAICPSGCEADKSSAEQSVGNDRKYRFVPGEEEVREQDLMQFVEQQQNFFLDCLGLNAHGSILRGGKSVEKRMEPNSILCGMLDGDAVYGSALGNRMTYRKRRVPALLAPTPITYFVIHNGRSAGQLGRMIRRQNLLGELRLAALLDAETIMELGAPIRRLSGLVSNLLSHGTRLSSIKPQDFNEVLELYTEIGSKCHGGFLYRMARASYYYDALEVRLKDLRSKPIQGWQSYPGFITRHFDQRFRSMRSTGERYIDVGTRIERLFALYGSARSTRTGAFSVLISAAALSLGISLAAYNNYLYRYGQRGALAAVVIFGFIIIASYMTIQTLLDRIERQKYYKVFAVIFVFLVVFGGAASVSEIIENDFLRIFIQNVRDFYKAITTRSG
jgi:hypothetical protein